jgi:hypothetical protein
MIESYLNSQRLRLSDRTLERRAWSFGLLLEVLADRPLEATTPEDVEAVLARLRAPESRKARGRDGCALFLTYRDSDWKISHAKALIVGRHG